MREQATRYLYWYGLSQQDSDCSGNKAANWPIETDKIKSLQYSKGNGN